MKTCTKCGLSKKEEEFSKTTRKNKNREVSHVLRSECKTCYNQYMRNYFKNNPVHVKRVNKGKKKRVKFVQDLKLEKGCYICGYNKSANALHYHHIDPSNKEENVSILASRQISEEKILKEIEKCVVLCANCHAEVESGITILVV
jgi:hypothetical protein